MNQELRIKLLKNAFFLALFFILTASFLSSPIYAACDATELDKPVDERSADCPAGLDQIEQTVGNIISVIVGLGFIALLVLLLTAGFKYLTSGGEPKAIQAAHQTVTWALLGIVFMIIAWIILQLIAAVTGVNVTTFDIKALCVNPNDLTKPFCE